MVIPITDPSKLGIDQNKLGKLDDHIEFGPMNIIPQSKTEELNRLVNQIVTDFERRGAVESPDDGDRKEVIAHSVVNICTNLL
jgi:hypothetical protein